MFNVDSLKIPKSQSLVEHAYHLYPVQIEFEKLKMNKSTFFEKMRNNDVNLQVHYIPIHLQPYYRKKYGFDKGDFPISENFYHNEVSLPVYPDLSTDDQKKVIKTIEEFINV